MHSAAAAAVIALFSPPPVYSWAIKIDDAESERERA